MLEQHWEMWSNRSTCSPTKKGEEASVRIEGFGDSSLGDFTTIFFLGLNLFEGFANFALCCSTFSHLNSWFIQALNSKFYTRDDTLSWNNAKSEFFLQLKPKYVKQYIFLQFYCQVNKLVITAN